MMTNHQSTTIYPLFTLSLPVIKNSSNSYYNLFVLPDELKMKKERFTTDVAAAASWQELQQDDNDIGTTGDVPTPTPTATLHHHQQQSSPRIDSSSSNKGAAAAATNTPNKEQEQGVSRERDANLPEVTDHDDNSSSSVDTAIYEDWHDKANDHSLRKKKVLMNIYKALITEFKQMNMHSADEWRRKLPQLAHRLESMHYQKSPTREVYLDINPKKMKNSLRCIATSSIYFQQLTAEAKHHGTIECDC